MADTTKAIARNTTDSSVKSFDVNPNAAGPTRITAERGVRYEFQDLASKNQGPANLRAQRVGKDLRISLGSGPQTDVVIEGFYDPVVMGDSPASIYGRGPDGLLYEYVPQAGGLSGVTAGLVDGAAPVSQVMSGSAVFGVPAVAATEVGALLPVAAAFSPLTAVLIGVGVAAAASGGGGGGNGTPTTVKPTVVMGAEASNNATTTLAKAGDTITVAFTSTDPVTAATIGGKTATVVHGTGNNYTATYVVQAGDTGPTAVSVTAKDTAGNTTTQTLASAVTIDTAAPVVTMGTEVSNNATTSLAKAGDTITVAFTSTDPVTAATIGGKTAVVTNVSGNNRSLIHI
jgi:hypothetical protein